MVHILYIKSLSVDNVCTVIIMSMMMVIMNIHFKDMTTMNTKTVSKMFIIFKSSKMSWLSMRIVSYVRNTVVAVS